MIVFHHNDLDGRCAAAIINMEGEHTFHEVDYKDEICVDSIPEGAEVAVVDFSFPPEVMAAIRKRASKVIWCDHHVTAKDYPYNDLPGYCDFRPKGLSGCECTWIHFRSGELPEAVKLIGDYDSWRLEREPTCFEFYEGMKIQRTHPISPLWDFLLSTEDDDNTYVSDIIDQGKACMVYRDIYCREMLKAFGHEVRFEGHTALALNTYRFGSKAFGENLHAYPICILYVHDGEKFTVSLYSESVDVSAIAKKHGGGGHKGAAGFVCAQLPWTKGD